MSCLISCFFGDQDYSRYEVSNSLYADKTCQFEKEFPAFKHYEVPNRTLDQEHLAVYGDQDIFRTETKKCVKLVLKELKRAKKNDCITEDWFRAILIRLGEVRHQIEEISNPYGEGENRFGIPRDRGFLATPLQGPYSKYVDKINQIGVDFKSKIEIDQQTHILSYTGYPFYGGVVAAKRIDESCYIGNVYNNFWEENDPVFRQTFLFFKEIAVGEYLTSEQLSDKIANFHWLFGNVPVFKRGSAWCGEVLTDSAWIFNDYVPNPIEKGKSLDLEAMTSRMEDYRNVYPIGIKV